MLHARRRRSLNLHRFQAPPFFKQHIEAQILGKTDPVLLRIRGQVEPEFKMRLDAALSALVQSRDGGSDEWLRRRSGIVRPGRDLAGRQFIGDGSLLTLATARTDLVMDLDGMIAIIADTGKRLLF